MNLDQTYGSLTLQDDEEAEVAGTESHSHPHPKRKELRAQLESLNSKLEELSSFMEEFSEATSACNPEDMAKPDPKEACGMTFPQGCMEDSMLTYRLCSLLDNLRGIYGFTDAGVFLCNSSSQGVESLALSVKSSREESAQEFEKQVKNLWEDGEIDSAINQKKRQIFSVPPGGSFVVVPFRVMDTRDGFWAMHFEKTSLPERKSTGELSFWTELLSLCIENSYWVKPVVIRRKGEADLLQKERLYTTTQLSRALMHEINNPLQVIVGRIQLLKMSEKKSSGVQKDGNVLDSIEANSGRICSLVKNFSDHLHRQSAKITGEGEVNLLHILNSDLALIKYLLNSQKITFETELEGKAPSVLGNPIELETAILGLIWELEDRLSSGGSITLRGATEDGFLRLDVHGTVKEGQKADLNPARMISANRLKMASGVLEKLGGSLSVDGSPEGDVNICIRLNALPMEGESSPKAKE